VEIFLQRDAEGKGRKWQESEQDTERHTQGAEPTPQHRPTQNTAEAEKAVQEHKPTGTEKSNNYSRHNPEQARPPKATSLNTNWKLTDAVQDPRTLDNYILHIESGRFVMNIPGES
jgi:hypothetical protein